MVMNYKLGRLSIIAALAVTLNACQHTEPGIRVERVPTPVPQPCLTAEQLAELEEPPQIGDRITGDPVVDIVIVVASNLRLRAWGRELFAAHDACAESSTTR